MLGVYRDPTLAWTLPCVVVALVLLWLGSRRLWAQIAAFALLAAPFLFTLASLLLYDDADERGDSLLALWPLLLVLAAALALANLFALRRRAHRCASSCRSFCSPPSTARSCRSSFGARPTASGRCSFCCSRSCLRFSASFTARANVNRWFTPALAAIISVTLLVCGGFYTASEERLSYANLPDGPAVHSAFPALAGLATPGPYLPEIDELLRYAQANIPFDDGIVSDSRRRTVLFCHRPRAAVSRAVLRSDHRSVFARTRLPHLVRARNIRWLIVKTDLQTKEDPTPDRAELMQLLMQEFTLAAHLRGYDVYRR